MGDGADGQGVSKPERELSPSGQGTVPPSGLGAEVLGAPRAGRCPERLWGCAGRPWLRGTLWCGGDGASGDSTLVSLALSWGTAQAGWLGQDGPRAVSSQGRRPLPACRHQCPKAFLGQPVAPTRAVLTNPALAPSHPAPLSPLFSRLLQAMAAAIALVLALLAVQHGLKRDDQVDVATGERMQRRAEYLCQEMTRLVQEIEQSRGAREATLLSALQQWPLWTVAGAVVLLAEVCWLAREMKLASDSCREQDSSSSEEEEDDDDEQEKEDLNGAHNVVRSLAASTPSPTQGLPDTCKVLKELVGDLLAVCRVLCKRAFMPQMHPAIGTDGTYEAWSVRENSVAYRLLVFLRPPAGHSFSLELDTTGQLPARRSGIHVVLECMCSREPLLGEILCFLHHPDEKRRSDQSSDLLRTLCTGSYLDVEKIACWVQRLVRSAWLLLPQSHHCQLTVLPSSQSCRFQLTSASKVNICTEMIFAVQQGSSGASLSLE